MRARHLRGHPPLGIEVRAGVHTGEVETIDGKVGGIGVHIGARVSAAAGPSEVLVSSTVKDLVAGGGLHLEDAGEFELKGLPERWRLYRVCGDMTAPLEMRLPWARRPLERLRLVGTAR